MGSNGAVISLCNRRKIDVVADVVIPSIYLQCFVNLRVHQVVSGRDSKLLRTLPFFLKVLEDWCLPPAVVRRNVSTHIRLHTTSTQCRCCLD
eukprot:gene8171-10132_t